MNNDERLLVGLNEEDCVQVVLGEGEAFERMLNR
jgi:hypothetical protein